MASFNWIDPASMLASLAMVNVDFVDVDDPATNVSPVGSVPVVMVASGSPDVYFASIVIAAVFVSNSYTSVNVAGGVQSPVSAITGGPEHIKLIDRVTVRFISFVEFFAENVID